MGAQIFTSLMSSCWIDRPYCYITPSLSLITLFVLRSNFSDMNTAAPTFDFHLPGVSSPILSPVCVSSHLKWVSRRQHAEGPVFPVGLSVSFDWTLCAFTFKGILDRRVPVAVCPQFAGWFRASSALALFLCGVAAFCGGVVLSCGHCTCERLLEVDDYLSLTQL